MATRRKSKRHSKKYIRLTVDLPPEEHRSLKVRASMRGLSMQEYVRDRIKNSDNRIADDKLDSIGKKVIEDNIDFFKRLADK